MSCVVERWEARAEVSMRKVEEGRGRKEEGETSFYSFVLLRPSPSFLRISFLEKIAY